MNSDSIDRAPTPRDLVLQLEVVVGVGMAGTVSQVIAYDRHVPSPDLTLRITPF